ncbi:MAG: hypothetical protein KDB14_21560 [Planctomycetales bacterium]|nr:hypothetical protein [Planctomycetales bacterium]
MKTWAFIAAILSGLFGHAAQAVAAKPLQVYILAGQSNMQGHAHVSTLDVMNMDPLTAPILADLKGDDGQLRTCERVWISSLGSADDVKTGRLAAGFGADARGPKIGPEYTFGIYMEKASSSPILIIKTAWGGKSLHTDFRSPSAGAYQFNESQLEAMKKQGKDVKSLQAEKDKATGHYYRLMLEHVGNVLKDIKQVYPDYDSDQGYELAGFVWFQGWNDMVDRGNYPQRDRPGGYDQYSELLAHFIRDVRRDLKAPRLPFVIGVLGVGGPVDLYAPDQQRYRGVHQNFRDAMAAPAKLPEFQHNVAAVLTEKYWDQGLVALRQRENQLKEKKTELNNQIKSGKLSRDEGNAAIERLYAEQFSPRELKLLRESTSNFEFHYLGSGKIMSQIGKGFAEAMLSLQQAN